MGEYSAPLKQHRRNLFPLQDVAMSTSSLLPQEEHGRLSERLTATRSDLSAQLAHCEEVRESMHYRMQ